MAPVLKGYCDELFSEVRRAFEDNFTRHAEIGASLTIYHRGSVAVDLWGGTIPSTGQEWNRDTLVNVFSVTKGMSAICLHMLVDRGQIELEAPVARYWPEFGCNGKEAISVAMAMSHQAGIPFWQTPIPTNGLLDWELATSTIALATPVWEPGTSHGYHAISVGFIWGEIVRRVTGQSIGAFFREQVAGPLGADTWIGLPEAEEHRVAPLQLAEEHPNSAMFAKIVAEPDWFGGRVVDNSGDLFNPAVIGGRAFRAAELPAVGGLASAAGVARLFAPLALDGAIEGVRLVGPSALPNMRATRTASDCDLLFRIPTAFTCGFSKTWGRRADGAGNHSILGEHAFGAPGMGGSIGYADPDAQLAFGYVMSRHGPGVALNERGQALVDAAYRSIGYASDAPGFWVRP
ncbi:MAG TPA: serine hydrolase domain-containing protein [Methylocella sp.]|nr:serine hydrolase domain-containing protein [Methylocella sp.]